MPIDELTSLATGRTSSLFSPDVAASKEELRARLAGKRVLVIGGAGSIGSATIREILHFEPAALFVVDRDENGLAELVRDLRSSLKSPLSPRTELRTLPLDFGSTIMERFLLDHAPWDYALNFAALKHVRSEKDVWCLLEMLRTNIVAARRLLLWLSDKRLAKRYFCVSTDKAANPVSLMGASKRLMEHVSFSLGAKSKLGVTSARFANVAFSNGSLLESFLTRLEKRQPLAVPEKTRRYFISSQEAGEICLLAAICAPDQHVLIPRLDASKDLKLLEDVATAVLKRHGYAPKTYRDEVKAKTAVESDASAKRYPLLLTPLDTSGEKEFEEFLGEGETAADIGFKSLLGIHYAGVPSGLAPFIEKIERCLEEPSRPVTREDLRAWMSDLLPELAHRDTGRTLDARM